MNDEAAAAQQARIRALQARWVGPLGLGWLKWEVDWHRGAIPGCSDRTIFLIKVRFDYQDVDLAVNLDLVEDQSDDELEDAFCHELGHVYTIPLKDAAGRGIEGEAMDMLEEHQATSIGRSLRWLRDHLDRGGDRCSLTPASGPAWRSQRRPSSRPSG